MAPPTRSPVAHCVHCGRPVLAGQVACVGAGCARSHLAGLDIRVIGAAVVLLGAGIFVLGAMVWAIVTQP